MKEDLLKSDFISEETRSRLMNLSASVGWRQKFVKRHALTFVSLHGEDGFATVEEAAEEMAELRRCLRDYEVQNIYNVDETGLFLKLLPRQSYIMS